MIQNKHLKTLAVMVAFLIAFLVSYLIASYAVDHYPKAVLIFVYIVAAGVVYSIIYKIVN